MFGVVGTSFVVSLLALIAWKTRTVPWTLPLIESGRPSDLLLALLHESRYEVIACGFVALNLGWALWQLGRVQAASGRAVERPTVRDESSAADTLSSESSASEKPSAVHGARIDNGRAQLEIAATELSRLRSELGACRLQLDAANAVKSQFLSNMSHELRTPLNGVIGMTDLLLGGELPARERRFAESIASSSNLLLGVISDLLDFSRIEAGTLYLERSRFRVREAVEDVCSMLADAAHAKGVELVCHVDDNVPGLVDGDANRLRQVIDNLVRNAIAFTAEGEVVVRMARVEERGSSSLFRCDVHDTGSGISPEMQMTMFDAFSREIDSGPRTRGGLGVGLTISRQLIAMMDGEIGFRSRLGEGTRFWFTIELGNVPNEAGEETRQRSLRGARALVVDDNETNRTILYHQLIGWGVHVDTADGAESALERLHWAAAGGVSYDVLVLDLDMPGTNGLEFARRIRGDRTIPDVPALMLTSALIDAGVEELAALGIERYISKPPRQSVLYDSLLSLLPFGPVDRPIDEGSRGDVGASGHTVTLTSSARVLLVEDNPVSQDVGVAMLESVGCRVDVACNGIEALERAAGPLYELILMDCRMPGMDGYEATAAIRAGKGPNARTPIVALTANAMAGDRERCLEAGMDDYLAKPVRRDDLNQLLLRWVKLSAPVEETGDVSASGGGGPVSAIAGAVSVPPDGRGSAERADEGKAVDETIVDARSSDGGTGVERALAGGTPDDEASAADARAPGGRRPLLNPSAIDAIRGLQRPGKPDLLGKVIGVYFDKTPAMIETMREALAARDMQAIKTQAHSLKSSSAYVGAEGLSDKCKRIERASIEDDFDEVAVLVAAIAEEFEAVSAELRIVAEAA